MENKKRRKIRSIILYIFTFLLTFMLFVSVVTAVIQSTVFSYDFVVSNMEATNYYSNLKNEIDEQFVSFGNASGFKNDTMKSIVKITDIKSDVNNTIAFIYGRTQNQFNTDEFTSKVKKVLIKDIESRGIKVTSDIDKAVNNVASSCANVYSSALETNLQNVLKPVLGNSQLVNLFILSYSVFGILIIISAVVIYIVSKHKHQATRHYIYSLTSVSILLLVFSLIPLLSGKIRLINFINQSMYDFAVRAITFFFLQPLYASIISAVLVLVLSILYAKLKNKAIDKMRK